MKSLAYRNRHESLINAPETDGWDESASGRKDIQRVHLIVLIFSLVFAFIVLPLAGELIPVKRTKRYESGAVYTYSIRRYPYWFSNQRIKVNDEILTDSKGTVIFRLDWAHRRMATTAAPQLKHLPVYIDVIRDLDSNSSFAGLAFEAICQFGPDASEAVAAIANAIRCEDPKLRLAAVSALKAIGTPDAKAALVGALSSDDQKVRHHAIKALRLIGGQSAAPQFALLARTDTSSGNRIVALSGLSEIKPDSAIVVAYAALSDENYRVRRVALRVLTDHAALIAEDVKPKIIDALSVAKSDKSATVRGGALIAWQAIDSASSEAVLQEALSDPERIVQTTAQKLLTQLSGAELTNGELFSGSELDEARSNDPLNSEEIVGDSISDDESDNDEIED